MKCLDIQKAIWAGEKSYEIDLHLSECGECRRQFEEQSFLIGKLRAIEVPLPSKSLLPSQEVIAASVKRNRRKPWTRYATLATTAAAVVVLGLFSGLQLQGGEERQGASPKEQASLPSPKEDANARMAVPQAEVTVDVAADAEHKDLSETLAQFLRTQLSPQEVRSVRDVNFTYAPSPSSYGVLVGTAEMDVELVPGADSGFIDGRNKGLVSLRTNTEGQWMVDYVEQMAAARTPEDAANLYALAALNRNGVTRYVATTEPLRGKLESIYRENNWTEGVSSPQLESYEVVDLQSIGAKEYQAHVLYRWRSSAGQEVPSSEELTIVQEGNRFYVKRVLPIEDKPGLPEKFVKNHISGILNTWAENAAAHKELLVAWGEPTRGMSDKITGNFIYRYDFPAEKGYAYIPTEENIGLPVHDEAGLAEGKMQAQVFVFFDADQQVSSYKLYYRHQGDVMLDEWIGDNKVVSTNVTPPK